jgi:ABC-2 type transport system ATP-binding protein
MTETAIGGPRPSTLDGAPLAIEVRGLRKSFAGTQAVRGIDLDVRAGETFGFLGPNGAGKSTMISMLCTLLAPDAGTARVAGWDVVTARRQVRGEIGLVFQDTTLDGYLSAWRNLTFHAVLYGVPRREITPRTEHMLRTVGLWERRDDLVSPFSGGMKRRLEIARGLLHSPRVLFLDEPTVGLDPQTRASIWAYIRGLQRTERITIFMTTHYLEEAEYCDRIAIVDHGRMVVVDTPEALKASVGMDHVTVRTQDDDTTVAVLRRDFDVAAQREDGGVSFSVAAGGQFVPRLLSHPAISVREVAVRRPSLDDVFLAYTGSRIRDGGQPAAGPPEEPGSAQISPAQTGPATVRGRGRHR